MTTSNQSTVWSAYGWCSDFNQKSIPAGIPLPGTTGAKEYFRFEGRYFAHYPNQGKGGKVVAIVEDTIPDVVLNQLKSSTNQ